MNNALKRSLEETSSKHPHQDSGVLSKLPSSVSKDHHVPYEIGQDSQVGKSKKDVLLEIRGNDNNKGTRYERDSHNDTKGDSKTEKDPLNWKDSREYSRKRHMDFRHTSHETGKQDPTAKKRDCLEGHEAVEENKIDSKSEDRFKERKRSNVSHQDWGNKVKVKEISDFINSIQVNSSIGENKESAKEDQDAEKWERERKDIPKNKEKSTEREKDHIKRESWDGVVKGVSYIEKDTSEYNDDSLRQTDEEFEPRMTRYQSQTQDCSDSSNHTDQEEEKRVELSNWVDVSGNEKKGHMYSDTVLSSSLKERPSGFMQKSSSYASTGRSHPKQPDLLEMGRLWLIQRNEEVHQAVLKAVKPVIIKEAEKYVEFETKLMAETYKKMEDMVNEELKLRKRMEEMSNQLLM